MSEVRAPSDIFGVPFVLRRQDAQQLVDSLGQLWIAQTGEPMSSLDEDLKLLFSKLFDPKTSGARLRDVLTSLPPAPMVRSRFLDPPLIIRAGPSTLVTPEGRAAYDLLTDVLRESDEDPIGLDPIDAFALVSLIHQGYRKVGVKRLEDAVGLLGGQAEGLRLPSIALLLFLLVNGSTSAATAIRRPSDSEELSRLDHAVAKAISAFADTLSSRARNPSHFSLYSGYAVTEARRRLGQIMGATPDEIYVDHQQQDAVIERVASELRRSQRSPETQDVMAAFDNLVSAYREERPTLASLGITHESRVETARLREQLERALGDP